MAGTTQPPVGIPLLFVTDLDGTLLNSSGEISAADLEALKRVNGLGCGIVAATGRPCRLIPGCVKNLPGLDYIISANGAVVYDCSTGNEILTNYLDRSAALAIYEETAGRGGGVDLYFTGPYIAEDRSRELLGRFMHFSDEALAEGAKVFTTVHSARPYLLSDTEPLIKEVCVFESRRECGVVLRELRRQGHVTAVTLLGYEIEVTSRNATKGNALAFIRRLRGIEKTRVMAIGDNENDLSMRAEAGFFIAMGNAGGPVKAAADYISASVDSGGVAQAIDRLLFSSVV
ncbi:MAG: Cof-type HAD-IIB family hydrolase [Spirochaetales bacterium]|jgi:Cof subfamily protein (haloacid dehalogenase superfamily)|nr:Cof-type HAD-IIB family hydrolase [Spirochaetales bacterium]